MELIGHYIGGKVVLGESGRTGNRARPGDRGPDARGRPREHRGGRSRGPGLAEAFPAGGGVARQAVGDHVRSPRARRPPPRRHREITLRRSMASAARCDGEVARGLENIEFCCGVPNLLKGSFSEQVSTGVDVSRSASRSAWWRGSPFNFRAMVPMWMFANAIACGNTFILKPFRERSFGERRWGSPNY